MCKLTAAEGLGMTLDVSNNKSCMLAGQDADTNLVPIQGHWLLTSNKETISAKTSQTAAAFQQSGRNETVEISTKGGVARQIKDITYMPLHGVFGVESGPATLTPALVSCKQVGRLLHSLGAGLLTIQERTQPAHCLR
jgi:hypothetical protein